MPARNRNRSPSPLRELSKRLGIIDEYRDQTGKETRRTTDESRIALLHAMGIEASDDAAARRALEELDAREHEHPVAPAQVVRRSGGGARGARTSVALPRDWRGTVTWELEIEEEGGATRRAKGRARAAGGRPVAIPLARTPELGYHTLRIRLAAGRERREAEQSLIVVPPSCPTPRERHDGVRMMGVIAQLYTIRSPRNWGVGDFEDLGRLLVWSAEGGAEFVGVNPLHALLNRGADISPYSPVSRVYRNPLYLAPELVPAVAASGEARALIASDEVRATLAELRAADRVDYERVMTLKHRVLRAAYRGFLAEPGAPRRREFEAWRAEQGEALERFATFMALDEHFATRGAASSGPEAARRAGGGSTGDEDGRGGSRDGGGDGGSASARTSGFTSWPEEFRRATSPAVRRFAEQHADDVGYHAWIQFELDAQLADAAARGNAAGMRIGLYQDLAIGASPSSSDVWSYPELFVRGVSIGAPPDPYSATGQNWGLPPIDPRRLRDDRYAYWIAIVRASLRHAGALRIDHIMGLFRQFWIPEGRTGKDGAYVRFPAEDLLGILALESSRAGAIVVGEDLGTVPEDVPPAMKRWGILSSKVLYFERDRRGGFNPASSYAPLALATANTHDMATLSAFWMGHDLEVRERVGLADARETGTARRERERDRGRLSKRLAEEGVIDREEEVDAGSIRGAVHAFLARTPSTLVGLSLDDLAGEVEPVNVPGVGPDRYPSWTRRMHLTLEDLPFDQSVAFALRAGRRPRSRS